MRRPHAARYIPPARRKNTATPPPDWFVREAIAAYNLSPSAVVAMMIIADNLNGRGESRTSQTLISKRGAIGRETAAAAVDQLLESHLLFELDPRAPGRIMRYAIPRDIPEDF